MWWGPVGKWGGQPPKQGAHLGPHQSVQLHLLHPSPPPHLFNNAVANVVIKVNREGDGWELWKPRLLSKLWTRKPEKPKALRVLQLCTTQQNSTQLNTFQFKTLICAIEENTENSFLKLSFFFFSSLKPPLARRNENPIINNQALATFFAL